jgi:lipopolysaccharide transport system ATP-binding protein
MSKILLKNVFLNYPVLSGDSRSFKKNFLHRFNKDKFSKDKNDILHIQALKNINISISSGEKIGLFGTNGSGKTTLLKIIAKIFKPTSGFVYTEGKISNLIELNAGLSEHLTGYENATFRLRLMGLNRLEIDKKIQEIIDFSELNEFIHLPIKTYSSGMKLRLAFSIMTCIESDIILMDEWLSIGDKNFQEKAQNKLKKLVSNAKNLVLASQNLKELEKNCDKIFFIKNGSISI